VEELAVDLTAGEVDKVAGGVRDLVAVADEVGGAGADDRGDVAVPVDGLEAV
jgi:hypothetical protein